MKRNLAFSLFTLVVTVPCIATAQPPGGGRGPGGRGPGGSPLEMMSQVFDLADANGDGQLTKTELTAAIASQQAENRQRRGGPPPGQGRGQGGEQLGGQEPMRGGPGGPPPRPGQVLPNFVAQSLNLTEDQQERLSALQTEVDKQLAAILTDEQEQQMQAHHRRGPHGDGGADRAAVGRANGRPQRPQ